jgi:hypothetical protein
MNKSMLYVCMLVLSGLLLMSCSTSTTSIVGQVDEINEEGVTVDCSNEVTKGMENVNSIGYSCLVKYRSDTVIKDIDGSPLALEEIVAGTEVAITLTKSVNIRKRFEQNQSLELIAKTITVMKRASV